MAASGDYKEIKFSDTNATPVFLVIRSIQAELKRKLKDNKTQLANLGIKTRPTIDDGVQADNLTSQNIVLDILARGHRYNTNRTAYLDVLLENIESIELLYKSLDPKKPVDAPLIEPLKKIIFFLNAYQDITIYLNTSADADAKNYIYFLLNLNPPMIDSASKFIGNINNTPSATPTSELIRQNIAEQFNPGAIIPNVLRLGTGHLGSMAISNGFNKEFNSIIILYNQLMLEPQKLGEGTIAALNKGKISYINIIRELANNLDNPKKNELLAYCNAIDTALQFRNYIDRLPGNPKEDKQANVSPIPGEDKEWRQVINLIKVLNAKIGNLEAKRSDVSMSQQGYVNLRAILIRAALKKATGQELIELMQYDSALPRIACEPPLREDLKSIMGRINKIITEVSQTSTSAEPIVAAAPSPRDSKTPVNAGQAKGFFGKLWGGIKEHAGKAAGFGFLLAAGGVAALILAGPLGWIAIGVGAFLLAAGTIGGYKRRQDARAQATAATGNQATSILPDENRTSSPSSLGNSTTLRMNTPPSSPSISAPPSASQTSLSPSMGGSTRGILGTPPPTTPYAPPVVSRAAPSDLHGHAVGPTVAVREDVAPISKGTILDPKRIEQMFNLMLKRNYRQADEVIYEFSCQVPKQYSGLKKMINDRNFDDAIETATTWLKEEKAIVSGPKIMTEEISSLIQDLNRWALLKTVNDLENTPAKIKLCHLLTDNDTDGIRSHLYAHYPQENNLTNKKMLNYLNHMIPLKSPAEPDSGTAYRFR